MQMRVRDHLIRFFVPNVFVSYVFIWRYEYASCLSYVLSKSLHNITFQMITQLQYSTL